MRLYHGSNLQIDHINLRGMIYKKTSSQYSFHTEKSIQLLRKVFEKLLEIETGLYLESPEYVYDLFKDEMNFGRIIQAEI